MSELRLVEHNVHRVAVEGRQMLFHIPTSSLFELDQVSGELLDMFTPEARGEAGPSGISADDVRRRFDGRHPPDTVVETLQEFLDLEVLTDGRPLHPDHVAIEVKNFPLSTIVLNTNSG